MDPKQSVRKMIAGFDMDNLMAFKLLTPNIITMRQYLQCISDT